MSRVHELRHTTATTSNELRRVAAAYKEAKGGAGFSKEHTPPEKFFINAIGGTLFCLGVHHLISGGGDDDKHASRPLKRVCVRWVSALALWITAAVTKNTDEKTVDKRWAVALAAAVCAVNALLDVISCERGKSRRTGGAS